MRIRVKIRKPVDTRDTDYKDWKTGDIVEIVSAMHTCGLIVNDKEYLDSIGVGTKHVLVAHHDPEEKDSCVKIVQRSKGLEPVYLIWLRGFRKGIIANGTLVRVVKRF